MKKLENKTLAMKYLELQRGECIEDILHKMYVEERLSIRDIANELDVHYHTVNSWLKQINIDMRLPHEKLLELVEIKRMLKENN